jgi:hypothetical protein
MDEASELAAAVEAREGFRYEPKLRSRVAAYARQARDRGESWSQLSSTLGVPMHTLQRWAGPGKSPVGFVTVRSRATSSAGELRLVSPAGWRIEGLSVSDVAVLLRELRL